jgi:hypothetical protein
MRANAAASVASYAPEQVFAAVIEKLERAIR